MDTIKIGIIGAGQIGKAHLEEYVNIPGVEVIAICDINLDEAKRVAAKYSVSKVYTDYREMLQQQKLDAIDVCLHNNYHMPVTIAALEAGMHVYCEKPIAGSYADGLKMLETAKACGKLLHIQLAHLFHIETRVAKQLIDAGKLGKLYHARSTGFRRRNRPYIDGYGSAAFTRKETAGGGALYDMGVYHIARMLYLMGNPKVERIVGRTYQEMAMDEERRLRSGFDVEEMAAGLVCLEGGITLDIIESWALQLGGLEGSAIVGSEGGIRLSGAVSDREKHGFSFHTTIADLDMDCTINLERAEWRQRMLSRYPDAYISSQHHWIAALQGQVALLPTADIALNTMLISEGLYYSQQIGREVSAEEVIQASKSTSIVL
ncbi:gfo/Idh/MocA family oxidoreductase [Paenibacillus lentus]|uniref:Gfo/Idh/MocA family oxidoreductase n=2 Tax=Paenibacillus lentus TaxID=1338368 RepID=A0A3Q8SEN6_9BACL|nr:Gfo/Idh/MocA family oxidoreductase [Paenibacillus lentus]AZK49012.1 gfo/Idh/MocA family oxidoreductase [Paenibacillus lentus]